MSIDFPDGFLWGTATAAHQVEGDNWNNDWWEWEHASGTACEEPSGDACDHYWRYPSDLDLLVELGFHAYRFSIEWSRIEPEENEWSRAARPLLAHARCLSRTRPAPRRDVPPLHDAAVGRGRRRMGEPGDRGAVRSLLRARGRRAR